MCPFNSCISWNRGSGIQFSWFSIYFLSFSHFLLFPSSWGKNGRDLKKTRPLMQSKKISFFMLSLFLLYLTIYLIVFILYHFLLKPKPAQTNKTPIKPTSPPAPVFCIGIDSGTAGSFFGLSLQLLSTVTVVIL